MHSIELFRHLFTYDKDSGELVRRVHAGNQKPGQVPGGINEDGYRQIGVRGKYFVAHRICWLMHYGEWPSSQIDHIDGDYLNNRIENLRLADQVLNGRNMRMNLNNTSGCCGVTWNKGSYCWQATIKDKGKQIYLGCYKSIFEAAAARRAAEIKIGYSTSHGKRPKKHANNQKIKSGSK